MRGADGVGELVVYENGLIIPRVSMYFSIVILRQMLQSDFREAIREVRSYSVVLGIGEKFVRADRPIANDA